LQYEERLISALRDEAGGDQAFLIPLLRDERQFSVACCEVVDSERAVIRGETFEKYLFLVITFQVTRSGQAKRDPACRATRQGGALASPLGDQGESSNANELWIPAFARMTA